MMEIKKGYTLSQFVDLMNIEYNNRQTTHDEALNAALDYQLYVEKYNDFLKQPLTKDMFVNEKTHPNNMPVKWSGKIGNPLYIKQLTLWQEAEKKVIFKDWGSFDKKHSGYLVLNHSTSIDFNDDDSIEFDSCAYNETRCLYIKTIGDLFRATNGELITQNITL